MPVLRHTASLASVALLLLGAAATPRAAAAGPPWIGVELPANPHDAATRGALAVVRLYHHAAPAAWPLEARAVGAVGGARRTVRLEARPLAAPGAFAVHGALPAADGWVLVLTMQAGPEARASALVALDRRGAVAGVRVPQDRVEGGRWITPREASAAELDAMLRLAVAAGAPNTTPARVGAATGASGGPARPAALAGAGLLALAPLALRRRAVRR